MKTSLLTPPLAAAAAMALYAGCVPPASPTPAAAPTSTATEAPTAASLSAAPASTAAPGPMFGITTPSGGRPELWQIPQEITYSDNGPAPLTVGAGSELYQAYLDQFSWQMFIAINWPALPNGEPNPARWIGAEGDASTVWEHWMNADDVFLPNGKEPPPWGTPSAIPEACKNLPPLKNSAIATVVFTQDDDSFGSHNKVLTKLEDLRDATLEVRNTGPLVDQNKRWARFETYINKTSYSYIRENKLYSVAGQEAFAKSGKAISFPAGSIEVKAVWKILDEKNDKRTQYHVAEGLFVNRAGTCNRVPVGLAGLHIASKTPRTPNKVWSTFEFDNNLCSRTGRDYKWVSGTFCSAACIDNPAAPGCEPNKVAPKPWIPPPNPAEPGTVPPSQVVRTTPIPVQTGQLNSLVGHFLQGVDSRSVWPNYDLVGTQWVMALIADLNTSALREWDVHPGVAPAPQFTPHTAAQEKCTATFDGYTIGCPGIIVPPILANSMIETYIQPASSCLGCHEEARTKAGQPSDSSFVLERAQGPKTTRK